MPPEKVIVNREVEEFADGEDLVFDFAFAFTKDSFELDAGVGDVVGLAGGNEVGAFGEVGDFSGGQQIVDREVTVNVETGRPAWE